MDAVLAALTRAQLRLESAGIASAVIGGLAVSVWGNPRLTQDVDFKVLLARDEARLLLEVFFPMGAPAEVEAFLQRNGILFVKSDDCLLSDTEFDRAAVQRRVKVDVAAGVSAYVCTAEDLIIYKLISTRGRDLDDARSVIGKQRGSLDRDYILGWLRQFEAALDDSTLIRTFEELS